MKLHRFIRSVDLELPEVHIDDESMVHQVRSVLRLGDGDQLIICNGAEREATATILSLNKSQLRLSLAAVREVVTEPTRHITLCSALLKRENFELVVQKAVEVGVHAIVPILSERTVKFGTKPERLRLIALEAAEQSGRGVVPQIHDPVTITQSLDLFRDTQRIIFHTGAGIPDYAHADEPAAVYVGPEGGWTDAEINTFRTAGSTFATLGKLTLRGETAAIVGSFRALYG